MPDTKASDEEEDVSAFRAKLFGIDLPNLELNLRRDERRPIVQLELDLNIPIMSFSRTSTRA